MPNGPATDYIRHRPRTEADDIAWEDYQSAVTRYVRLASILHAGAKSRCKKTNRDQQGEPVNGEYVTVCLTV
jgi:hypothetical protein